MLTKKPLYSSTHILLAGAALAGAAGIAIPFFVGAVGDSTPALLALPFLLAIAVLFVANRQSLLLLILTTRSAGDIILESTRGSIGGQNIGLGAVINACVILLTLTLVFESPRTVPKKMVTLWLGFFIFALVGIAFSPVPGDAFRLYLTWMSNFAIFVGAFYVILRVKDFRYCARLMLWSSVLPVGYSFVDIALNLRGGDFRLKSTFMHANIYAFYLMLVILFGFYLLKDARSRMPLARKAWLSIYVLILLAMLVLTQTRSAWLACIVVFAAYGIMFERRYLLYLAGISVLALMVPAVHDRLMDLATGNTVAHQAKLNSFAWRVALWQSALEWMSPQQYLLGYGIGAFRENAPVFFKFSAGIKWDAHNVYVQWFFDVGALGLLTFLWIYARLLYLLRPLFSIDRLAAFIIYSLIISYLLISFSDNMMFYLSFNWYFWFAIGSGCALVLMHQTPTERRGLGRMPVRTRP